MSPKRCLQRGNETGWNRRHRQGNRYRHTTPDPLLVVLFSRRAAVERRQQYPCLPSRSTKNARIGLLHPVKNGTSHPTYLPLQPATPATAARTAERSRQDDEVARCAGAKLVRQRSRTGYITGCCTNKAENICSACWVTNLVRAGRAALKLPPFSHSKPWSMACL